MAFSRDQCSDWDHAVRSGADRSPERTSGHALWAECIQRRDQLPDAQRVIEQLNYLEASAGRFERFDTAFGYGDALAENISYRVAGYLTQGPTLENLRLIRTFRKVRTLQVANVMSLVCAEAFSGSMRANGCTTCHYERDRGINVTPRNDSLDVDDFEISSEGLGLKDTENDFYGMSLRARTVWNGWDVMSLSAYEGYKQDYGFDFDGSPAPYGSTDFNANLS